MKKKNRRSYPIVRILITVVLLCMLFGVNVVAASKTVTMKKVNKTYYTYSQVSGFKGTVYHKFVLPSDSIVVVYGNADQLYTFKNLNITLCNSRKKEIRRKDAVNSDCGDLIWYGLKKGTYYLKTSGNSSYILGVTFEKWADKGGCSKSKAYNTAQKKVVKGLMPVGEKSSKADWFKLKVKKKGKLCINIKNGSTGRIRFQIYGPSVKKGYTLTAMESEDEGIYYVRNAKTKKVLKVKPGTYYIKVSRKDKNATGGYAFSWKRQ